MKYVVKITGGAEGDILFTEEEGLSEKITQCVYKLDTVDDNTLDRDTNARCTFEIHGIIDVKSADITLKLAKWSKEKKSVYRKLEIEVYDDGNDGGENKLRYYEFDRIFCIDYTEEWGLKDQKNDNRFTLYLAQGPNWTTRNILA